MQPEFVMCFAVASPRPIPFVAEITIDGEGRLSGVPDHCSQHVLPIGSIAGYYGLDVDELREQWIVAAMKWTPVTVANVHRWGVSHAEWADVLRRHVEIVPIAGRHTMPAGQAGPHNDPAVQEPLERAWASRPRRPLAPGAKVRWATAEEHERWYPEYCHLD